MRTRNQQKKDEDEKKKQEMLAEEDSDVRSRIMDAMNRKRVTDPTIPKIDVMEEFERLLELTIAERNRFEAERARGVEMADYRLDPEIANYLPRIEREIADATEQRARNGPPPKARATTLRGRGKGRGGKRGGKGRGPLKEATRDVHDDDGEGDQQTSGAEREEEENMDVEPPNLNKTVAELVGGGFDLRALFQALLPLFTEPTAPAAQETAQPERASDMDLVPETPILRRFGHRQDESPEADVQKIRARERENQKRSDQGHGGAMGMDSEDSDDDVIVLEEDAREKKQEECGEDDDDEIQIMEYSTKPDRKEGRRVSRRDSLIEKLKESVRNDPHLRKELESLLRGSNVNEVESGTMGMMGRKRQSLPEVIIIGGFEGRGSDGTPTRKKARHAEHGSMIYGIVNATLRNAPNVDVIDVMLSLNAIGVTNATEADIIPLNSVVLPTRGEVRRCLNFKLVAGADGTLGTELKTMLHDDDKGERAEQKNRANFGFNLQCYLYLSQRIGHNEAAQAVFLRSLSFILGRTGQFKAVYFDPSALVVIGKSGEKQRRELREWLTPEYRGSCNEAIQALTPSGRINLVNYVREIVEEQFWF